MRIFKVTSEYNYYFGREGALIRENEHDVVLSIENNDFESRLIFDKTEVEEVI